MKINELSISYLRGKKEKASIFLTQYKQPQQGSSVTFATAFNPAVSLSAL